MCTYLYAHTYVTLWIIAEILDKKDCNFYVILYTLRGISGIEKCELRLLFRASPSVYKIWKCHDSNPSYKTIGKTMLSILTSRYLASHIGDVLMC